MRHLKGDMYLKLNKKDLNIKNQNNVEEIFDFYLIFLGIFYMKRGLYKSL